MHSFSVPLGSIIRVLVILLCVMGLMNLPITSRFSVQFNPLLGKRDEKSQSIGAIFAKIPQDLTPGSTHDLLKKTLLSSSGNLGMGSTNQIAKIILPAQSSTEGPTVRDDKKYINVPIISQPFGNYSIIVATAPRNIRIGKGEDAKPVVVYIVFPDDDSDLKSPNIPSVYFITKPDEPLPFQKKKEDPIIVIDSNRTVTGLKSKAMTKFVKFKNKMTKMNQLSTN